MSLQSKLKQSRNQWKVKAGRRADDNWYLRKELARVKNERDQFKKGTCLASPGTHESCKINGLRCRQRENSRQKVMKYGLPLS